MSDRVVASPEATFFIDYDGKDMDMKKQLRLMDKWADLYMEKELHEDDFEAMGFNPDYYAEHLGGDLKAVMLTNGDIAELCGQDITGMWSQGIYHTITWE